MLAKHYVNDVNTRANIDNTTSKREERKNGRNRTERKKRRRCERKIITEDDVQFAIQIGRYLFSFGGNTQQGVSLIGTNGGSGA